MTDRSEDNSDKGSMYEGHFIYENTVTANFFLLNEQADLM